MVDEIEQRINAVHLRMAAACERAGREMASVRLVAVSKTYPPAMVCEAARLGCDCFGESRVYEAAAKVESCPGHLEWHFIGHLQRNKVRPALQLFSMLHAVDSIRLLDRIEQCASEAGRCMPVCLEVNISGEASKYGFIPEAVPAALAHVDTLRNVRVEGLMTMAPFASDPEASRPYFARLRTLRDRWSAESGFALTELSMGMSGDFEVAIEEGATLIRVGSQLFGARPPVERNTACE